MNTTENKIINASDCIADFDNSFTDLDLDLSIFTCQYKCTAFGIFKADKQICVHPIVPCEILENVETGTQKMTVAYKKNGDPKWKKFTASKSVFASSSEFIKLSDYGIAVHSKNAKDLAAYLSEIETYNNDTINKRASVSRLGWITPKTGGVFFSPFTEDAYFDGDQTFGDVWDAISEQGNRSVWVDQMHELRKKKGAGSILLAASFASVLVGFLDLLPFFVHIWGGTGVGKTVGLKAAASVWGNPEKFVASLNATNVGLEHRAAFFNSLPLCLDELQILASKGEKDFDGIIYQLAEGIGKVRGKKDGGLQNVPTWKNCFITSGEQPINTSSSGGGAMNRVIEIECKEEICSDFKKLCETIKENYGFAGREFVEHLLTDEGKQEARNYYSAYYDELCGIGSTDKQAQAAALILTADTIVSDRIFNDGCILTAKDVARYMKATHEVDVNERAYSYLIGIINANRSHFGTFDINTRYTPPPVIECWGAINESCCYFNPTILDRVLADKGFNKKAFLSWAIDRNIIAEHTEGRHTIQRRFGGVSAKYVCLKIDLQ